MAPVSNLISAQVERIRQKAKAIDIRVNPCISNDGLETFERFHNARLSDGYRHFILEVGNGGDGPPMHGIAELRETKDTNEEFNDWYRYQRLHLPFPFTGPWSELEEPGNDDREWTDEEVEDYQDRWWAEYEKLTHGSVFLGGDGCGRFYFLVVNGPWQDTVWYAGDGVLETGGLMPVFRHADFLTWYETWLIEQSVITREDIPCSCYSDLLVRFPDQTTKRLDIAIFSLNETDFNQSQSYDASNNYIGVALVPNAIVYVEKGDVDLHEQINSVHQMGTEEVIVLDVTSGQVKHSVKGEDQRIFQSPVTIELVCGCICTV